ncbi:MAG TPA: hypothetical protein VK447_02900, partial [Myxococcaceae bacterium]|nr:hypothetical protein [Myxococcaceae bacterium]
ADGAVRTRYADYDGANEGVTKAVTLVFTRAEPMEASCQAEPGVPFMGAGAGRIAAAGYPVGDSGMSCTASARITGLNIPLTFMDRRSRGWFKEDHWTPRPIYMCGAGRATGPNCLGRVSLLLDDWGFSGPDERKNCLLMDGADCANTGYYRMLNAVFVAGGAGGDGSASRLASLLAGVSPTDENAFFMSFAGSDSPYGPFTDNQQSEHLNVIEWETTPFRYPNREYEHSFNAREKCFLGLRCN